MTTTIQDQALVNQSFYYHSLSLIQKPPVIIDLTEMI